MTDTEGGPSLEVRLGEERDIDAVRDIFVRTYEKSYPYQDFFDAEWLKRSVYSEHILMLVAVDERSQQPLGTASIVLDVGADSDLVGEFGRLAVDPDARGRGVGSALMQARLSRAAERLHVAVVEARTAHPYSQKIALQNGFRPVGFLPQKHCLGATESVVLMCQHFGAALKLRRNNPRLIVEVKGLAHLALEGCGLVDDSIVDESAVPYPNSDAGADRVVSLQREHYPELLRIQRGRTRQREVFGAKTLQHGFFKIAESKAEYLVSLGEGGEVSGALGLLHDDIEDTFKLFELVFTDEQAVAALLDAALESAQQRRVRYIEVDVSADAPRMQRSLLERGFIPAAYVPALVFVEVERVDVVRFVHLVPSPHLTPLQLEDACAGVVRWVERACGKLQVAPRLRKALSQLRPFSGVTEEQAARVMAACQLRDYAPGQVVFSQGENAPGRELVFVDSFEVSTALGPPLLAVTRCGARSVAPPTPMLPGAHHLIGAVSVFVPAQRSAAEATFTVVWKEALERNAEQSIARHATFRIVATADGSACTSKIERTQPTQP